MPDVTDEVTPSPSSAPEPIHVYVYVEGGMVQAAAASVPIELHIMDKDNHEGINVNDEISRLFAEHQLNYDNVVEDWVSVEEPLDTHVDTSTEEAIPD